jgi:hypothetical protein
VGDEVHAKTDSNLAVLEKTMNRLVWVAAVGLVCAGIAQADIPPPSGLKRVSLEHKITTDKEYPDYVFYAVSGGDKVEPVKIDPKTPAVIKAGGGRYRFVNLVVVPKGAAKEYQTDKEFNAAIASGKVTGQVKAKTGFDAFTTVKDGDTRRTIVKEYRLEKIDDKDGIVLAMKKDATSAPVKDLPDEDPTSEVAAFAPRGGVWVAGLTASLALVLTGLWLTRRNRTSRYPGI